MSLRLRLPCYRQATIALSLALSLAGIAVFAVADARAAYYKMVACAGNNGAPPHSIATNTAHAGNPAGIFHLWNWCSGQGGDPPGDHSYIRIQENQPSGNAGHGAYGHFVFDAPAPHIHFKAAGGHTRQPHSFNAGWRARFWVASCCATAQIMTQGIGLPNAGGHWATTSTFGPHLWPIGDLWDFNRFVYEMTCVNGGGCDRSGTNATDLNGLVFILSDNSPAGVAFTNTGSPLLAGSWVKGTQHATFNVSDLGSGIRHERMRIDGSQVWGWDHWPECNTSSSGLNGEWARAYQPCPTGTHGRSIPINTAAYPDGARTLQICNQDYSQYQGLFGTGGETCSSRTVRFDNTPPGAPSGLHVTSANPERYLDRFGAQFSLPPNQGSPIAKVHYNVVNAAGAVVKPVQSVSATNPTALSGAEGPKAPGNYRLRVWLEDQVGHVGPATTAPIPRDTMPPAAPQDVSVAAPSTDRAAEGFDVRWRNVVDAGSPIDAVHYQVLDGSGGVAVPVQTLGGEGVQAIPSLDAPEERGNHTLRFWLSDAEGNVGAPVSVPLSYRCVRSRVGGGAGLTSGLGADGADNQVVREGSGSLLGGSLQAADGSGVAGAPLCVFARVVTDAEREFVGIAISGRGGSYGFPVQAGASREISVVYRHGHRELSAQATLHVRVRPTFKLHRKVVRNKRFARFHGRIPGPHNDKVVIVLQVKQGKGWLAFRRYRTRDDGRFVLRYRFRRTHKRTRYVMRAQVRHTVGYPYLQGNSRSQRLTVLPSRKAKSGAKRRPRR